MKSEPKIVALDIETLADLKQIMANLPGLSAYPGLTLKASLNSVICFGYQTLSEGQTRVVNAWDDVKRWSKDVNDDKYVLERIHEILDDADVIVTHNGKRFDWKFIQTRMLKHNLPPLRRIPHIDTCQLAKQHLYLFNNRLNTLAKFFTNESKMDNGGWELWEKVLVRHKPSMKLMAEYCAQDVNTLVAVFKKLKPFAKGMPNMNVVREVEDFVCPKCGSTRINKRGKGFNQSGEYIKVHCRDCLSWSSMKDETKTPKAI